jgi:hypothetical protein
MQSNWRGDCTQLAAFACCAGCLPVTLVGAPCKFKILVGGMRNAKSLQLLMNFSLILGYIRESKITNWSGILQQKQQQNLPQS